MKKYNRIETYQMFVASLGKNTEYSAFAKNLQGDGVVDEPKTQLPKEYDKYIPDILEENGGEMTVKDILAEYQQQAAAANPPVEGAKDVTTKLLKGYLNIQGKLCGILKVKNVDNTYVYDADKDTRDASEDEATPEAAPKGGKRNK